MRLIRKNVERVAESEAAIEKLKAEGFKELEKQEEKPEMPVNLADMNVTQLKALAKQKGLEGCSGLSKEELLEVLEGVV